MGCFVAVKSELRRRGPVATMTGSRWSVRWSSAALTLHSSPSEPSFRVGAVLSLTRVAEFGAGFLVFHTALRCGLGRHLSSEKSESLSQRLGRATRPVGEK